MQVVKDETYGAQDETVKGGWNGMVGELVRRVRNYKYCPLNLFIILKNHLKILLKLQW